MTSIIQAVGHLFPLNTRCREIVCYNNSTAPKFDRCFGSSAAEAPVATPNDWTILILYLVVSRFRETKSQDVLWIEALVLVHPTVHNKSRWYCELNTFPNLSHGSLLYLFDVMSTCHCPARLILLDPFPSPINVPWIRLIVINPQVNNMNNAIIHPLFQSSAHFLSLVRSKLRLC